jgi:hypothetical protein
MKKISAFFIIMLLSVLIIAGCGSQSAEIPKEDLVVVNAGEEAAEDAAEPGSVKPEDAGTVKPEDEGSVKPLGLE